MTQASQIALIGVGSNQPSVWGDARETVQRSITEITCLPGLGAAASQLYASAAFPAGSGPDFVNAALAVHTYLSPQALIDALHRIESLAGRRRAVRWGPRTLDLDLIGVADRVLPDLATYRHWRDLPPGEQATRAPDQLILPHPRLQDRAFVLVPLAEVAPAWRHPVSGLTVVQMRDALPTADRASVRPLA